MALFLVVTSSATRWKSPAPGPGLPDHRVSERKRNFEAHRVKRVIVTLVRRTERELGMNWKSSHPTRGEHSAAMALIAVRSLPSPVP